MGEMIVFIFGVVAGVVYEKQIRRYKDRISAAAKTAVKEFTKEEE